MKTLFAIGLGMLVVASANGFTFEDDFSDGVLDAQWTEQFYGSRSAVEEGNGVLRLTQGGRVRTTEDFPACTINGRARLVGSGLDQLALNLRLNNLDGVEGIGIGIASRALHPAGDSRDYNIYAISYMDGVRTVLGVATSAVPMNAYFDFRVEDDGHRIQVYVDDMTSPVMSFETDVRAGESVMLGNRELSSCVTEIDWVTIERDPHPPVVLVQANGQQDSLVLKRRESLEVAATLSVEDVSGDTWVVVMTSWSFPLHWFAPRSLPGDSVPTWAPWLRLGYRPLAQGPIPELDGTIFESSSLPPGLYLFYVAFDSNPNGLVDSDNLVADSISVEITW